jgi:NAD(P)-dependent dehydrogenase (short-subunit alcohol dehydrogenase family)
VKEGAFVFIAGRRQAELDKAVADIGHDVRALQGDVAKLDELDWIIDAIRRERGTSTSCSRTRPSAPSRRWAASPRRRSTGPSTST